MPGYDIVIVGALLMYPMVQFADNTLGGAVETPPAK
jgi:hypothetical protein